MPTAAEIAAAGRRAEATARAKIRAELAVSAAPPERARGNPPKPIPDHLLVVGLVADDQGDHVSILAAYGQVSVALAPGIRRRFSPKTTRELIARLQIAADHADGHGGEQLAGSAGKAAMDRPKEKNPDGNDLWA